MAHIDMTFCSCVGISQDLQTESSHIQEHSLAAAATIWNVKLPFCPPCTVGDLSMLCVAGGRSC